MKVSRQDMATTELHSYTPNRKGAHWLTNDGITTDEEAGLTQHVRANPHPGTPELWPHTAFGRGWGEVPGSGSALIAHCRRSPQ